MIRAAVAGLGWWGKHIVRRMKDSDALRVVTAIEANPAHAGFAAEHGIAFTTDFAAVLRDPDIDAVILCTPGLLRNPALMRGGALSCASEIEAQLREDG